MMLMGGRRDATPFDGLPVRIPLISESISESHHDLN